MAQKARPGFKVIIMRAVVVYESLFGNTRLVAEAIAEGIGAAPGAIVACLHVPDAGAQAASDVDLLVVGGPTHMRGMTSHLSRSMGLRGERERATNEGTDFHPEDGAEGPGVRDWLHSLPSASGTAWAAAFDTRVAARMAGGAANGIAKQLRRRGYRLLVEPEGFMITDTEGPLADSELERARSWGASLHIPASRAG